MDYTDFILRQRDLMLVLILFWIYLQGLPALSGEHDLLGPRGRILGSSAYNVSDQTVCVFGKGLRPCFTLEVESVDLHNMYRPVFLAMSIHVSQLQLDANTLDLVGEPVRLAPVKPQPWTK